MILLSFDIEEFDMPFEYDRKIDFKDQMSISIEGTIVILDVLKKHNIKATFFSTVIFALNAPKVMERIIAEGHEIASHSYYHSDFKVEHLLESRLKLEEITGQKVLGYRMPRMQPVNEKEIYNAGYTYNSSLNPTFIPGRYNNFNKPRTYFMQDGVLQIPASVTPIVRFPLFWLSFHNLPLFLYKWMSKVTLTKDKYINIYFHPWEFTDLNDKERFNFPSYISKNSGTKMTQRIDNFIHSMKSKNYIFGTFSEFLLTINPKD
ncbi:polysaccharide deacetylase family protein [Flavobacterium sp.]|jgi:peptidoglycan/xylan/chitin deacetylase (PgdA/CDA1 family)|uniref:polysaccharide deacetylase family protein n=1 Tax=Flavobacterium sp. TaxID=239 RepID=UPI003BE50096